MTRQSLPDAEVPDPGRITSQQDFGRELTLARQQAGLTIREVAKASGIPVSTVGDYFAARHLPPARQSELLPNILAAQASPSPHGDNGQSPDHGSSSELKESHRSSTADAGVWPWDDPDGRIAE